MLQVATIIGAIFLVGSIILLVASTILIANTIRLSIFSRRREIEVMKLVGASNWFVRAPVHARGAALRPRRLDLCRRSPAPGARSWRCRGSWAGSKAPDDIQAWSFPIVALILVGMSLLVGAAGSGITLRRFLRV